MTRPRTTDIVDRRQFCRTTAAAGVALSVFGLPDLGRAQSVQVSNRGLAADIGKVVIADAIRFGNGMGHIDRGGDPRCGDLY